MSDPRARLTQALADRYRIEREIGQGGMAVVYLAHDLRHDRKVAVKVLRPELAAAMGPERFLREIQIAARLTHPHILPLHDSGEADGFLYYVMPYVQGESLRQRLSREHELPVSEVARILREVVDALAKAHAEGVVHRDIKPDNVLLADRHALVTDFGVAKAVSEATGRQALTTAGVALGTPAYMAPEQAAADDTIDHRADIYAVGAMAYEMLTGQPPFSGTTAQAILAAHVTQAPEPVTARRETVPPPLADLVMRCLAKRAADRWQSAADMLPTLESMSTPSGGITPTETRPVSATPHRRNRWLAPVVSITSAVGVVAIALGLALRGGNGVPVDRELIAAFPFAVSGSEDLQYLGEGMVNLFESNLSASEGLRALASQQSVQAWREAGGTSASDDQLRAAARRLGAGLMLQGNLVASGQNLVINASLVSSTGAEQNRATATGPVDSIAVLVGRLTAQLMSLHAGERADRTAALADVPMDALKAYLEGQIAYRAGKFEEALDRFGRAIAIDSTFALAALSHAMAAEWVLTAPASPGLRLANRYRDKLSERDQALLEAKRPDYPNPVNTVEMVAAAERGTRLLPDRPESWYYLGDRILHYGQLLGMHPDEVRQRTWAAFNRGLAIDPNFAPIVTHKFDQAWLDENWTWFRALQDSYPAMARERWDADFVVALRQNDSAAVTRLMHDLDRHTTDELFLGAMFAVGAGGLPQAVRLVEARLAKSSSVPDRVGALQQLRGLYWTAGEPSQAAAVTERIRRESRGQSTAPDDDPLLAALLFDGDSAQGARAAAELTSGLRAAGIEPGGAVPARTVSNQQAGMLCQIGLWRSAHGGALRAGPVGRQLEAIGQRDPDSYAGITGRICGLMLRALLATGAEQRALAEQLDSIAATGPAFGSTGRNVLGFVLARLFASMNEPRRAMQAAMRADQFGAGMWPLWGEAGRYALAAGDSAIAVYYLNWYLPARQFAEPASRARDDELRRGLAKLVGEGGN